MKKILVTGGKGQLALCLKELSTKYNDFSFVFLDIENLDITNKFQIDEVLNNKEFHYCINCAAYTAVDKAEKDLENANKINNIGVKFLAESCAKNNTILIHISTDFVFDGKSNLPYKESDFTKPLSGYGITKLKGEEALLAASSRSFIIRTSWLYSEYGVNFVKTMLRFASEKEELNIIYDQIGTPTYAKDLADTILKIISSGTEKFGVYHYSNEGVASWYDFTKAIFEIKNKNIIVNPILTTAYPTPAQRPQYSILDKSKIKITLDIEIPYWRESLKRCLERL